MAKPFSAKTQVCRTFATLPWFNLILVATSFPLSPFTNYTKHVSFARYSKTVIRQRIEYQLNYMEPETAKISSTSSYCNTTMHLQMSFKLCQLLAHYTQVSIRPCTDIYCIMYLLLSVGIATFLWMLLIDNLRFFLPLTFYIHHTIPSSA